MVFDLPDVDFVTNRLLRNPKDFEMLLSPLYGERIASAFADLFTSHLVIAAQLVKRQKREIPRLLKMLKKLVCKCR